MLILWSPCLLNFSCFCAYCVHQNTNMLRQHKILWPKNLFGTHNPSILLQIHFSGVCASVLHEKKNRYRAKQLHPLHSQIGIARNKIGISNPADTDVWQAEKYILWKKRSNANLSKFPPKKKDVPRQTCLKRKCVCGGGGEGEVRPFSTIVFSEQTKYMENLSDAKVFNIIKGCPKKLARAESKKIHFWSNWFPPPLNTLPHHNWVKQNLQMSSK